MKTTGVRLRFPGIQEGRSEWRASRTGRLGKLAITTGRGDRLTRLVALENVADDPRPVDRREGAADA